MLLPPAPPPEVGVVTDADEDGGIAGGAMLVAAPLIVAASTPPGEERGLFVPSGVMGVDNLDGTAERDDPSMLAIEIALPALVAVVVPVALFNASNRPFSSSSS